MNEYLISSKVNELTYVTIKTTLSKVWIKRKIHNLLKKKDKIVRKKDRNLMKTQLDF